MVVDKLSLHGTYRTYNPKENKSYSQFAEGSFNKEELNLQVNSNADLGVFQIRMFSNISININDLDSIAYEENGGIQTIHLFSNHQRIKKLSEYSMGNKDVYQDGDTTSSYESQFSLLVEAPSTEIDRILKAANHLINTRVVVLEPF